MDDRTVRRTQETLGKVIKKPPLTDKLLKKPPFRFLHDIMTSVSGSLLCMRLTFTSANCECHFYEKSWEKLEEGSFKF